MCLTRFSKWATRKMGQCLEQQQVLSFTMSFMIPGYCKRKTNNGSSWKSTVSSFFVSELRCPFIPVRWLPERPLQHVFALNEISDSQQVVQLSKPIISLSEDFSHNSCISLERCFFLFLADRVHETTMALVRSDESNKSRNKSGTRRSPRPWSFSACSSRSSVTATVLSKRNGFTT